MPSESDQAIGFLLEFDNQASPALQQATEDFQTASQVLEEAVDAAQAAFVFLEEGTGSLAQQMGSAIDAVNAKTGELRESIQAVGSVEVSAPQVNHIEEAIADLGENISEPIDSGVQEVTDSLDQIDEKEFELPMIQQFMALQESMGDTDEQIAYVRESLEEGETVAGAYVRTLRDMDDAALVLRKDLRKTFEGMDSKLVKVGKTLMEELIPNMEEFGERGRIAATHLAGDAVDAYARLQKSAEIFFEQNSQAFSEANNVADVWAGFIQAEDSDIRKVQDLLRVADKATLEPLVAGLVEQLGDAALAEEFWKPIANNKNVDREFFTELRQQFLDEDSMYKNWWDKLDSFGQELFWDKFSEEGSRRFEKLGKGFKSQLSDAVRSPIAQIAGALALANIVMKIFGPAIDVFVETVQQALMPAMRIFSDIMQDLQPVIYAVTEALTPMFESLGEILNEVMVALVPLFNTFGELLKAVAPLVIILAEAAGDILVPVFDMLDELIMVLVEVVIELVPLLQAVLDVFMAIVNPILDVAFAIDEYTGILKILSLVLLVTFVPSIYAAVAAVWSFTAALLANPITWIVLAIVGAVWLLVEAFQFFWELAKPVLNFVWESLSGISGVATLLFAPFNLVFDLILSVAEPVMDFFGGMLDFLKDWGVVIGFLVGGPIGWLIGALSVVWNILEWIFGSGDDSENTFSLGWVTDGFSWLTDWLFSWVDWIPGWMKWLIGIDDELEEDTVSPEETVAADRAMGAVESAEEGVMQSQEDLPDWYKAMVGIENSEVARLGEAAKITSDEMLDSFVQGMQGAAENAPFASIFKMMTGDLVSGFEGVASMFRIDKVMDTLFGDLAAEAKPASAGAVAAPAASAVSVGQVEYDVKSETKGEDISSPIVDALRNQTFQIVSAINGSGREALDLDLSDLKDVASFN